MAASNIVTSLTDRAHHSYAHVAAEDDVEAYEKDTESSTISSYTDSLNEEDSSEKSHRPTWLAQCTGWCSMALAILACASIGPTFRYIMSYGITPLLAACWRGQAMVICLLPTAVWEAYVNQQNPIPWFTKLPDMPYPLIIHMLFASIGWSFSLLFWIVGLRFISTFKASVLAACHPIMLVLYMRCTGKSLTPGEYAGVGIAFVGVVVSNLASVFSSVTNGSTSSNTISDTGNMDTIPWYWQSLGVILCLLSAFGETMVIINRIQTRLYVPLFQYTLYTTLFVACTSCLSSLVLEESRLLCMQSDCVFGWLSKEWCGTIFLFGLWIGAVCITGFNYAMSYIPPLVFSSLSLLDPAITAILSYVIGVEDWPSVFSWLGGGMVVGGVAVISSHHNTSNDSVSDSDVEGED